MREKVITGWAPFYIRNSWDHRSRGGRKNGSDQRIVNGNHWGCTSLNGPLYDNCDLIHIISYHIVLYRVVSYHIISYHIVLYPVHTTKHPHPHRSTQDRVWGGRHVIEKCQRNVQENESKCRKEPIMNGTVLMCSLNYPSIPIQYI